MTSKNVIYVGADVAKDNVVVAVNVKGTVSRLTMVDHTLDGFKVVLRELKQVHSPP